VNGRDTSTSRATRNSPRRTGQRQERLADVCHHTGGSRGGASVSHASHDYKVANCDIKVLTASSCLAMPLYPRKQTLIADVPAKGHGADIVRYSINLSARSGR
jgi:hypothetical protein